MEELKKNEKTWNLNDLLPEHKGESFDSLIEGLKKKVEDFEKKRPSLRPEIDAQEFQSMFKELEEIQAVSAKISAYGELWFSEDTSFQEARAYLANAETLLTELANKTLFISLWWKKLDEQNAGRLLKDSGEYRYFLERIRKLKEHALEESEEKIINLKDMTGMNAFAKLYDIITSDFKFSMAVDGAKKKLNVSELMVYVRDPRPEMREMAYKSLFKIYKKHTDVLGEIYFNLAKDWDVESLQLRKYPSPISVRNKANDVSDEAVQTMLEVCRENACIFAKYFQLKAKSLGIEKMSRYHIYAPLGKEEEKIGYDEAIKLVLETFESFSPEIAGHARKVFEDRHVHAELGKNKRSGAFCYSVHPKQTPYVLLNYTEKMRDVATLAHELGHAVHSMLASNKSIFTFHAHLPLAETASVFGELIVTHKLMEKETNPKVKKELLAEKIDDIYATIIRQTYFILFEQEAHKKIQKGATIKEISDLYLKQLREQFEGIDVPKIFSLEWTYIPHIYQSPFYCYAYSFGNLLTLALYKMYKEQGDEFIPKYIKLLSYGGSESPEKILSELGIDINKKEFWQKGFDAVKEMIGEFERL